MRGFSITEKNEIERKIRELAGSGGSTGSNVFSSLTGSSLTGSNLYYTNGTFGVLSATLAKFHILSASYHNISVSGTASGSLATFGNGIFDTITASLVTGSTLNFTIGNIQTINSFNGIFTKLTATNANISNLVSNTGLFVNLTGTNTTGSSLLFTNASIQTLTVYNSVFTILTATNLTSSIGRFHVLSASNHNLLIDSSSITGTTLNYTNGNIQTLTVFNGIFTKLTGTNVLATTIVGTSLNYTTGLFINLTGTNLTGSVLNYTTANIQTLNGFNGIFTKLTGTNGLITSLTGSTVDYTTANLQSLTGLNAFFTRITGTTVTGSTSLFANGTFGTLSSTIGQFHILSATNHNITINTSSINGVSLNYTTGLFVNLTGTNLTGSTLNYTVGNIQTINSFNGIFTKLTGTNVLATTIVGTSLSYTTGLFTNLTGTNTTGSSLFFTNGTIQTLNVYNGVFTKLTGTSLTGSSLLYTTGLFGNISSTIGQFHVLSASTITGSGLLFRAGYFSQEIQTYYFETYTQAFFGGGFTTDGFDGDFLGGNITQVGQISATSGVFTNLTSTSHTGSSLLLTTALIQKITASVGITGSGLFFTNASIQTLNVYNSIFTILTATNLTSSVGRFHILSATNHNLTISVNTSSIFGDLVNYTTGIFTNLTASSFTTDQFIFDNGGDTGLIFSNIGGVDSSISSILIPTGTFKKINVYDPGNSSYFGSGINLAGSNIFNGGSASFNSLVANAISTVNLTGSYITGSSLFSTTANIQTLTSNTISASIGRFHILSATNHNLTVSVDTSSIIGTTLNYTTGLFTNLTGTNLTGSSLLFTSAIIQKITASVGITGSSALFTNTSIQTLTVYNSVFTILTATNATFTDLTSSVGRFHILSATNHNLTVSVNTSSIIGTSLNYTTGLFISLTGTNLTGSVSNYTTANIQTLTVYNSIFTILTATNGLISTLVGSSINYTTGLFNNLTGTNLTGSTLNYTTANIQTLNGFNGVFTKLTGTNLTGSGLFFTNGNFINLNAYNINVPTSGRILMFGGDIIGAGTITGSTITASIGNYTTLNVQKITASVGITGSSLNFTTANIQTLNGYNGIFTFITGANVLATTGLFTNLTGTNLTGSNLLFTNASIQELTTGPLRDDSVFFDPNVGDIVYALENSGSVLYLGGIFTTVSGSTRRGMASVNKDSGILSPFNPDVVVGGPSTTIYCILINSSSLYLGGHFTTVSGSTRNNLACINKDSGVLSPFNPAVSGGSNNVYSLLISGSNLYVGGSFTTVSGSTRNRIAIVDKDSGALGPFNPSISGGNGIVYSMLMSGSNLYIGGDFTTISGSTRNRLAVVDKNSGALGVFNPNIGANRIYSLLISGSNLYLGGDFTTVSGSTRNRIAVVNKDSGALGPFNPNSDGPVNSLEMSGSNLYLGGSFSTVSGSSRVALAVVDKDSGALSSFNANISAAGVIQSLKLVGSDLYIGGDFSTVSGSTRNNLAVIDKDSALLFTETLYYNDFTSERGLIQNLTGSSLLFTNGTIQTLNGYNGIFTTLTGTNLTGSVLSYTSGTFKNLTVLTSSIIQKAATSTIACGNDQTWLVLDANTSYITGTGLITVMTVTGVDVGRYRLDAMMIYQTTALTTGVDFAVDHTGTTTQWLMEHRFSSTGQLAATAAASESATNAAGNIYESQGQRTKGAVIGSGSVSVDIVNTDLMSKIEGFFVVSASGSLQIKMAASAAGLFCRAMQGSNLILTKFS